MRKLVIILLLLFSTVGMAQDWQFNGTKYPNATNVGDTVSLQTHIPIIDSQGLLNYYLPAGDLLELNQTVTWENITGDQGAVNISGFFNDAGYLTTETDPTVGSHIKAITTGDINTWDSALQTEIDPTVPAHVKGITTTNISTWNSALQTEVDPTVPSHVKSITTGDISTWSSAIQSGDNVSELNNDANYTTLATTDTRYLRSDISDDNGVNELTLGGLNLPSIPVGLSTYDHLVVNPTTGEVNRIQLGTFDFEVGDGTTTQFNVNSTTPELNFVGSGDTSVSFNGTTNTVTITSIPGAGGGGAVTSFEGRDGAVVSQAGDYNTGEVNELGSLYFTEPRVRSTTLTGFATGANTGITATDNILQAFGKVQGQLNGKASKATTLSGYGITDAYTKSISDGRYVKLTGSDVMTGYLRMADNVTLQFGGNAASFAFSGTGNDFNLTTADKMFHIRNSASQDVFTFNPVSGNFSATGNITGANLSGTNTGDQTLSGLGGEPVFSKNTAFNKNFGSVVGTVKEGSWLPTFNQVLNKPTTLAGYGITDAYTKSVSDGRYLGVNSKAVDAGKVDGISLWSTGKNFDVIPIVKAGGVFEVGRYIDFHITSESTSDNDGRLGIVAANELDWNGLFSPQTLSITGTAKAAGRFYGGSTNPSNTTRLNYDGNLYVNNLTAMGGMTATGNIVSDSNIQASGAIITGAGIFTGRVSGADAVNDNEFVTRRQVAPIAASGSGLARLAGANTAMVSNTVTSGYYREGGTTFSVNIPAGTFSDNVHLGALTIDLNAALTYTGATTTGTEDYSMDIVFIQGSTVDRIPFYVTSIPRVSKLGYVTYKMTAISRSSAGIFMISGGGNQYPSGAPFMEPYTLNIDARQAFTIRIRKGTTGSDTNMDVDIASFVVTTMDGGAQ